MFVDASAIVAILAGEADASEVSRRLIRAATIRTSALAVFEAVLGLARIQSLSIADLELAVRTVLLAADAEIIPIDAEIGREAIRTFERFGRGRHPVRLNMGDCFAYARARSLNAPLLFKGDDFAQTDIPAG